MDNKTLQRLSEVMGLQEQLRERCSAIIVPQLLTNMLLLDILAELKELNKSAIALLNPQDEGSKEEPKKPTKITKLEKVVSSNKYKGKLPKKSK